MASLEGGAKLKARLAELSAKVAKPGTLNAGFLEGATYPDGTSVAMVAAIQEFGAPEKNIPSRPFMRRAVAKDSAGWGDAVGAALKATNYDVAKTLGMTGEVIKGDIQQSIVDTNDPPLSPKTIAAKGFAKPLIDTGHMRNSVDYEVET